MFTVEFSEVGQSDADVVRSVSARDIARFYRPDLSFLEDSFCGSIEAMRWYDKDRPARQIPLDFDELVNQLMQDGLNQEVSERLVAFESRARPGDKSIFAAITRFYDETMLAIFESEEGTLSYLV